MSLCHSVSDTLSLSLWLIKTEKLVKVAAVLLAASICQKKKTPGKQLFKSVNQHLSEDSRFCFQFAPGAYPRNTLLDVSYFSRVSTTLVCYIIIIHADRVWQKLDKNKRPAGRQTAVVPSVLRKSLALCVGFNFFFGLFLFFSRPLFRRVSADQTSARHRRRCLQINPAWSTVSKNVWHANTTASAAIESTRVLPAAHDAQTNDGDNNNIQHKKRSYHWCIRVLTCQHTYPLFMDEFSN